MTHTISSYEQQAVEFLNKTNCKLVFTYLKFDKYFEGDESKRNIFKWELIRGDKMASGTFGQSINDSCKPTPKIQSNEPVEIYFGISVNRKFKGKLYFSTTINTNCAKLREIRDKQIDALSIVNESVVTERYVKFVADYKQEHRKEPGGLVSSIDAVLNAIEKKIFSKIKDLENETTLLDQADDIVEPTSYDLLACLTKNDPGTFDHFCSEYGYDSDSRKAERIYKSVVKEWEQISNLFTPEEIELLQEIN